MDNFSLREYLSHSLVSNDMDQKESIIHQVLKRYVRSCWAQYRGCCVLD